MTLSARFELVVQYRAHGLQLPLRRDDVVRLFDPQTHALLGEVSGDAFYALLVQHITQAALSACITGQLEGRLPVVVPQEAPAAPPSSPAPRPGPISAATRASLRATRQGRAPRHAGRPVLPSWHEDRPRAS